LLFAGLALLWRRALRAELSRPAPIPRPSLLFLGAAAAYVLLMLAGISFYDANTPIDHRLLSPVLPLLIVFALPAGQWLVRRLQPGQAWRALVVVLVMLLAAVSAARASIWTIRRAADDYDSNYTARNWRESETIAAARQLPPNALIYSNAAEAAYIPAPRSTLIPEQLIPEPAASG
jgi:hypothetical protein